MTGPELIARHSARCRLCGERIRKGQDYVSRIPGGHWVHALCAQALRRTVAENEEAAR
jgi:hypothetical protein